MSPEIPRPALGNAFFSLRPYGLINEPHDYEGAAQRTPAHGRCCLKDGTERTDDEHTYDAEIKTSMIHSLFGPPNPLLQVIKKGFEVFVQEVLQVV